MCLTIPAEVLSIEDPDSDLPVRTVSIRDSRGERRLSSLLIDLEVGDWVLYASDTIVARIDEEDAREILELLEPVKKIDLSSLDPEFLSILKACHTRDLNLDEITRLLASEDPLEMEALFAEANTIRQAKLRDFFCIHGIVEFSNRCVRSCKYCGLRSGATGLRRYAMAPNEIVSTVIRAVNDRGYKLIVLQSGDDFSYTDEMLVGIIKKIKESCKVFIFMSVGERGLGSYARMRGAGASGVLFRFETSKSAVYEELHPGQSFEERMAHLEGLKSLGYFLATGFLIGLPGQTTVDLAGDILAVKNLGANMVTVGPFIPAGDTPLSALPAGSAEMTLKVIAVSRLLMPGAKIPVTTALETIESDQGRRLALSSGANSLMFNLTPEKYRNDYIIYPGKYHGKEELWEKYGLYAEELSYKMLEKKMFEAFEERG